MNTTVNPITDNLFFSGIFEDLLNHKDSKFNPIKNSIPSPPVNIFEDETGYYMNLAVPGYKKEELEVTQKDSKLTVSYKEKEEAQENVKYIKHEYTKQAFSRTFALPEKKADIEKLNAELKDGILSIYIPKKEVVEISNKIEIK